MRLVPVHTRIPFRYGITELTSAPHAVVSLRLTRDEGSSFGMSAENLPPKWFTKNPESSLDDDLAGMVSVVLSASGLRRDSPRNRPLRGGWRFRRFSRCGAGRRGSHRCSSVSAPA